MVDRRFRSIIARFRRHDGGQSLVEFALIVPIFLLLVIGVIEFGQAWNVKQAMVDAGREGCRVAVVANPTTTLDTVAHRINRNLVTANLDTAAVTKSITGFRAGTDSAAVCTLSYPYQLRFLQPFMGWTGQQASFTITTSVKFRNE